MTFLTCGNLAFEWFLRNLILNFQMDFMQGNTLIVVCFDGELHARLKQFLAEKGAQRVSLVESLAPMPDSYANYGTATFRDITRLKFQKIAEYAREMGEIYYVDGDVAFFRDPVPEIKKHRDFDFVFQPEHPSRLYENPCTGNFVISGSGPSLDFMKRVIALNDSSPGNDQDLVCRWLKTCGSPDIRAYKAANLQVFNSLFFQSGYVAFRLGLWTSAVKVCVHANFRVGMAAKVNALRHCRGWFCDPCPQFQ